MAYSTVESIVSIAINKALKIRVNQTDDMIHAAVDFYNQSEPFVWRKLPWHNRKIDEFEATPDTDGIITFSGDDFDVDMIVAVRAVGTGESCDVLVFNQDEISAYLDGETISSGRFKYLSDAADGSRRILVNSDDDIDTYKVLAKRRFVMAEVNAAYSAGDPSATPNDYRVLTWKIDRAEQPLIEYIADQMRAWSTIEKQGTWAHSLNAVAKDLRDQENTEHTFTPQSGIFGDLGDFTWYGE